MKINCFECGKFTSSFDQHWHKIMYAILPWGPDLVIYYCKRCFDVIDIPDDFCDRPRIYPRFSNDRYWNIREAKEKCEMLEKRSVAHS